MFRCQLCGEATPPRTPAARIVVARRPKVYPRRTHANVIWRLDDKGKRKEHKIDDPGGVGWEAAREVIACPRCAAAPPTAAAGDS